MERNKSGFLALIGLVTVASLFTACKASGAGSDNGNAPPRITWTVTFDADDGTSEPVPVTVFDGETLGGKFPEEPPRDSFTFDGWWTKQNGGGTPFNAETVVREDIILYALWTPVYDYTDESNNGWTELANFITGHQGAGNSAANPASVRIINAGTVDAAAMAAVSAKVTAAEAFVFLDLSGAGNSFADNTVTPAVMLPNIQYNTLIKGIALPEGVTALAQSAFIACPSLASVILPESLISIGGQAFYNCTGLASVTLPAKVSSIGDQAFYHCSSLVSADLSKCTNLSSIDEQTFYNCPSLASVILPEGLISIDTYAFYNCDSLEGIDLPASLNSIGQQVFQYCDSLASVDLPASVTSIGAQVFQYCDSLARVTFNSGAISIGSYYPFPGDLYDKYGAGGGGIGTYTREVPDGTEWTKQE